MSMRLDGASCAKQYQSITAKKPLIQCITNFVSMDLMANCLNAVGASPAMVSPRKFASHLIVREHALHQYGSSLSIDRNICVVTGPFC